MCWKEETSQEIHHAKQLEESVGDGVGVLESVVPQHEGVEEEGGYHGNRHEEEDTHLDNC